MKLYVYKNQPTNYSITKDGKIFNNKTNKWLKGQQNKNGYWSVTLTLPNDKKRLYIHRMVLETYNPNPNSNILEVNHKDGNKSNNLITNLEWVTPQENKQHAIKNYLNSSTPIYGYDENYRLIYYFASSMDLYRATGWSLSGLSQALNSNPKFKFHNCYWTKEKDERFQIQQNKNHGKSKPVAQYDLNGNLLRTYESISEAGRTLNISKNHISECCNKRLKTYKGFIWKFL